MSSDDSGDAPRPSRQPGELPQLRIFRFRRGGPPGGARSPELPADSPAGPPTPPVPGDSPPTGAGADDDEPEYLEPDADETGDAHHTGDTGGTPAAGVAGDADPGSERTGGTRPIQLPPPPAATPPPGWNAAPDSAGDTAPPVTPPPGTLPAPSAPRRRRLPLLVGGGVIVVVLAILAWFLVGGLSDDTDTDDADPAATATAGTVNDEPLDANDWSQRVCASVNTWNAETGELAPTLTGLLDQGSDEVGDRLVESYETLTDAAQTLSGDITALAAPEIEGGRPAAQELSAMAEQVIEDVAQGRSDAAQVEDGDGPLAGPTPQELVAELTVIVDTPGGSLRELVFNADPPLRAVFDDTPDCADYV